MKTLMQTAAIALALTLPVLAGGFYVEFGNPTASSDPKAKDALTTIRATGCHEPEKATFTAAAEGKVDGKRKTIPLEVVALSTPGMHAIKGTLPKEGAWIITVSTTLNGSLMGSSILPVSAKGVDRTMAKTLYRPLSDNDLAQALRP